MTNSIPLCRPSATIMMAIGSAVLLAAGLLLVPNTGLLPTVPTLATAPMDTAPAADAPASSIAWTLPAGWTAAPAKPMRLAVFNVPIGQGASGECGVFLFPGGGDRLANVNRWRGQVGLPPIDAGALDKELTTDACAFGPFAWLTVKGERKAFLAAIVATPTGQCFVKLEGPPDLLAGLQPGFLAFCRSLRPAARP